MWLKEWDKLPREMQCEEVRKYYAILSHRKVSLVLKRVFDIVVSLIMIIVLLPLFLLLSLAIVIDSRDGIFFRQTRVTAYGKKFRIIKFRTMVPEAEQIGSQLTVKNDMRVTKVGRLLRGCRLDELPQLFNILVGDMTFVGTRPEIPKYVEQYSHEMLATLLLPAGVTSEASIFYKDESRLLENADDANTVYINEVLPGKMHYNLRAIENFGLGTDIRTMLRTVLAILGKEYVGDYDPKEAEQTEKELIHK